MKRVLIPLVVLALSFFWTGVGCNRAIEPHSVITYETEPTSVTIWSYAKIREGTETGHTRKSVKQGDRVLFEDGSEVSFVEGGVRLNNQDLGKLTGNWIYDASSKNLQKGFIPTFH